MADIETFDVYAMASGTTYPEDTLSICFDGKKARQYAQLERKIDSAKRDDDIPSLEAELETLKEELKETSVTVLLRGLSARKREEINDLLDSEFGILEANSTPSKERARKERAYYTLYSIQTITNASGATASVSDWDVDKMDQWLVMLPDYYRAKLESKIVELTFKSDFYEQVEISTDF